MPYRGRSSLLRGLSDQELIDVNADGRNRDLPLSIAQRNDSMQSCGVALPPTSPSCSKSPFKLCSCTGTEALGRSLTGSVQSHNVINPQLCMLSFNSAEYAARTDAATVAFFPENRKQVTLCASEASFIPFNRRRIAESTCHATVPGPEPLRLLSMAH